MKQHFYSFYRNPLCKLHQNCTLHSWYNIASNYAEKSNLVECVLFCLFTLDPYVPTYTHKYRHVIRKLKQTFLLLSIILLLFSFMFMFPEKSFSSSTESCSLARLTSRVLRASTDILIYHGTELYPNITRGIDGRERKGRYNTALQGYCILTQALILQCTIRIQGYRPYIEVFMVQGRLQCLWYGTERKGCCLTTPPKH